MDDDSSSSQQPSDQPPASASDPPDHSSSSGYDGSSSGFHEYDGSASNSRTPSGSGGSAGESSPSVKNYPQEADQGDNINTSSSAMQSKSPPSTGDQPPGNNNDDMDVDVAGSSTSSKPQPKSSAGKETAGDTTGANTNREGKTEEIGLLTDLYSLHNRSGRYHVMAGSKGEPDFYKHWIREKKKYANKQELDNKIEELHARYLKNIMDKNVEGPTDPIDVEILRLSEWIWGADQIDQELTDDGDDDQEQEEQDSDDQDLADDVKKVTDGDKGVSNLPDDDDDSSRRETAKKAKTDHHGSVDDQVDPKDSTKESGPIKKDN